MTSVVPSGTNVGNVSSTVVDAAGNVFILDDRWGVLTEIPANGGTPVVIQAAQGQEWGWRSLSIDDAANLYFHNCWGGQVFKFANQNGSYPTRTTIIDFGIIPNPQWWNNFAGLAVDPTGRTFYLVVANWSNSVFQIQFDATGAYVGKTQLIPSLNSTPAITLDRVGNLFYQVSNVLYEIPAGSASPVTISSAFGSANGIFVDVHGNVFVTEGSNQTVVKIPFESGALNPANQTTLLKPELSLGGGDHAQPVFVDANGVMYLPLGGSGVLRAEFNTLSIPAAAAGQVGSPAAVQLYFNSAISPSFSFLVGGAVTSEFEIDANSTCASGTAYAAGATCSLSVALAATTPGSRHGVALIDDGAGNVLGTVFLSSIAQAPGLVVDPGTQLAFGSGHSAPSNVSLDGIGNLFVADPGLNAVKMFPVGGGAAVNVGAGLLAPSGVTVDGAGNVYISDTGNNRVVLVPRLGGVLNNGNQIAIATGLSNPEGIVVDGHGAVYVAEANAGKITKITKSIASTSYVTSNFGPAFTTPAGLAVDGAGNLFVADRGANTIIEVPASGGSPIPVATGLASPTGVAVDAAGSVYVADSANQRVIMVPFVNGAYSSTVTPMGKGLVSPRGVTIDNSGNLYIADAQAPGVVHVARTQGQLTFGSYNLGTSSGTLNASLYNVGNQPLTLSNPFYSITGDAGDFTVSVPASGCDPATPVAPADTCSISALFAPTAQGQRAAAVALQSTAQNAAGIELQLGGTGANLTATNLTLTVVSPATGNPVYGQTAQVMATVTAPGSVVTPTGTVIFSIDGHTQPDVTLTNAAVTIPLIGLTGGSHTVTASYSGDTIFAASTSGVGLVLTVDKAPSTATLTVAESTYSVTKPGNFTVAVTSSVTGIPSGEVSFKEGAKELAKLPLKPENNNTANWTPADLPAGTHQIVAVYNGDANYAASTSAAVTVTITAPPDFSMTTTASAVEVPRGGSGQFVLNVAPRNGMANDLNLSCKGFADPTKASCVFIVNSAKQPNATLAGTAKIQALADGTYPPVTVQIWAVGPTNATLHNAPLNRGTGTMFFAFLLPGIGIVTFAGGVKFGRRAKVLGILIITLVLLAMLVACGGNSLNTQTPINPGAGTGTSTVTLSITSVASEYCPSVTHEVPITLTVK